MAYTIVLEIFASLKHCGLLTFIDSKLLFFLHFSN